MNLIKKIWWLPLLIYMIISPSFISDKLYDGICRDISISVSDSVQYRFITSGKLLSMLQDEGPELLGARLGSINIREIESMLRQLRELETVEVYLTTDGVLHVEADQRDPLMRVISEYGNNYYIDKYGMVIPHSNIFTPRLTVVSGNIEVPDSCILGRSILEQEDNSRIKQAFRIIEFIYEDEFWSRQLEQIWINEVGDFELVPRVGDHIVKFGPPENYETKFNILRTFYDQSLPAAGWEKYEEIDMRFRGQLVCRKKNNLF